MRLLNIETFQFTSFRENNRPKYVILSHRWVEDHEVTLEDVENRRNTDYSGYRKIVQFADYVKRHIPEIAWLWVDTCCINKKDAVELSKSLNLMFGWYRDAELCIAYLADVDTAEDKTRFEQSEWFLRGWTLQELLAPPTVTFVTTRWDVIGKKGASSCGNSGYCREPGLEADIARITGIPEQVLHDYSACIEMASETKMQWMQGRCTTEAEDSWYALFGILGVTPGANYGEGHEGAKQRLLAAVRQKNGTTAQRVAEFREITSWLDPPDPWTNHHSARELRDPESGNWLLESETYQSWKTASTRHLWMCGKAGCGKTVLCSTAIEDVKQYCDDQPNSGYAIFYFTFSDNKKQSLVDLLRSLVAQLGWKGPALHRLQQAYDKPNRSSIGAEELGSIVTDCFEARDEVFLLLDALDECPEDTDNRHNLFKWLGQVSRDIPSVKIFATSRELPDIRVGMTKLHAISMPIGADIVNKDVRRYVVTQLSDDHRLSRLDETTKRSIEKTITAKADGMFRWAYCQIQELKKLKSTKPSLVRKALHDLPRTLDETYERILVRISDDYHHDAVAMLRFLAFCESPPTLAELGEVTIIDWTGDGHVNTEDRPRPEDALEILSGLVVVYDEEYRGNNFGLESDTMLDKMVRLAHFSVQEYLESERILQSRAKTFHLEKGRDHKILAHSCLAYLHHFSDSEKFHEAQRSRHLEPLDSPTTRTEKLKELPLLHYATMSWDYHSRRQQPPEVAREIRFLSDSRALQDWLMIHGNECVHNGLVSPVGSGLYHASWLGHEVLVSEYLRSGADPNAQAGLYGNALQAALSQDNDRIVEMLVDAGADVNAVVGHEHTALHEACMDSNERAVEILLHGGANPNIKVDGVSSPLRLAAENGDEKILQMLLDAGADVNDPDYYGGALTWASLNEEEKIVQILIAAGADVNAKAMWGEESLNALDIAMKRYQLSRDQLIEAHGGCHEPEHGLHGCNEEMVAIEKVCGNIVQMLREAGAVLASGSHRDRQDADNSNDSANLNEADDLELPPVSCKDGLELPTMQVRPSIPGRR